MLCIILLLVVLLLWYVIGISRPVSPSEPFTSPLCENIYFINLDHREKKRTQMKKQIKRIKAVTQQTTRVPGITINANTPRSAVPLTDAGWAMLKNKKKKFGLTLTEGAVGCALAHKSIWEKVAKTNHRCVLILEDDVQFPGDFVPRLQRLWKNLPKTWDIVYLGSGQYEVEKQINEYVAIPRRIYGLFGYLVNGQGCRNLLTAAFPLTYQLDTELWSNFKNLEAYVSTPLLVKEVKTTSDIQIR